MTRELADFDQQVLRTKHEVYYNAQERTFSLFQTNDEGRTVCRKLLLALTQINKHERGCSPAVSKKDYQISISIRDNIYDKYGRMAQWDLGNITSLKNWFTNIDFEYCRPSKEEEMLDIGAWNVENIEDMSFLFQNAINVKERIDFWKPIRVITMESMFENCTFVIRSAITMPINHIGHTWKLESIRNMACMFERASHVPMNLENWSTYVGKVTNMASMFCEVKDSYFTGRNIENWQVEQVTDMSYMFYNCSSFCANLQNWNVSNVTNMNCMFFGCSSLTDASFSSWSTSKVTTMERMFQYCKSLKGTGIDQWDISSVQDMSNMFHGCTSLLADLDFSLWKQQWQCSLPTKKGKVKMDGMFEHVSNASEYFHLQVAKNDSTNGSSSSSSLLSKLKSKKKQMVEKRDREQEKEVEVREKNPKLKKSRQNAADHQVEVFFIINGVEHKM